MKNLSSFAAVAILAPGLALATPIPVDLTDWVAEGDGTWTVAQPDKDSVTQTQNGEPTVFHNNLDSQGQALSGTIRVNTTSDNDFVGFVLGYKAGDLTAAAPDFILIDWKKATQEFFGCDGTVGLSISRVTGPLADAASTWCHTAPVQELQRGATLGATGWVSNVTYTFDLEFNPSSIKVSVNGVEELNIAGTFADGAFGFYNYSQQNVTYAGLTQRQLPPEEGVVPLPAAAPLLLAGLGGLVWLRRRPRG